MKILPLLFNTAFISSFAVGADLDLSKLGLSTQNSDVRESTRRFNSVQEMWDDGSELYKMFVEKRYQEVLDLPAVLPGNFTNTLDDSEYYAFYFTYSNAASLIRLADDGGLSVVEKYEKYENALRFIGDYERQFDTVDVLGSCIERTDLRMKNNRMQLYALAAEAWARIERIYASDATKKQIVKHANSKCIFNFNKHIINSNAIQSYSFHPLSKEDESNVEVVGERNNAIEQRLGMLVYIKSGLPNAYFSLLSEYATASVNSPLKLPKYIQNINKIIYILEKLGRSDLCDAGKKTLEMLEKRQEVKSIEKTATSNDRRLNLDRKAHLGSIYRDMVSSLEEINSLSGAPIKKELEIFHEHARVMNEIKQKEINMLRAPSFTLSEWQESFESYRNSIIGIERKIFSFIHPSVDNSDVTPFHLEIYRKYEELIGLPAFIETFRYYISSFVLVGDLEAALMRSQAFQIILQGTGNENTSAAREQVAFIKNLLGDPTELLAIEAEKQAPGEKETVKQIEEQKMHLERLNAQDIGEKSLEVKRQESRIKVIENAEKQRQNTLSTSSAITETMIRPRFSEDSTKADRHQAAVKRRETEKDEATRELKASVLSTVVTMERVQKEENIPSSFTLRGFYNLRGVALIVDEEIEGKTWYFTKEQLISHYEAMGCRHDSERGKGSHEVTSLPKSLIISNGDQVITVMNDSGGSLTLPIWENKVPHYLKKQILAAREKLKALAYKASKVESRH